MNYKRLAIVLSVVMVLMGLLWIARTWLVPLMAPELKGLVLFSWLVAFVCVTGFIAMVMTVVTASLWLWHWLSEE
jgi:hypothetical protein